MNDISFETRLLNMRRSQRFEVSGKNERNKVQRIVKLLKRLDMLKCDDIKTRELEADKFEVYAL